MQRTSFVNRMHNRPSQREKYNLLSLQWQWVVLARMHAVDLLEAAEQHDGGNLDQLAGTRISHTKLERRDVAIGRNDSMTAEQHLRRRPRKARKQKSGRDREPGQSGQRLDRDHHICGHASGYDISVADGGEGLHAEEERAQERIVLDAGSGTGQGGSTTSDISQRRHCFSEDIPAETDKQNLPPGHG